MSPAEKLMDCTRHMRPDLYEAILRKIQPYSLESFLRVLDRHLTAVPDLNIFNEHLDRVPEFVWSVVKHARMPVPGDAFGIDVVCRVSKSETQGTLDSKHLQTVPTGYQFNVQKDVRDELDLFSNHLQVFELANRRLYATVFVENATAEELMTRLPNAGRLFRDGAFNKAVSSAGSSAYLQAFRYLVTEHRGSVKVLYRSQDDLFALLRCVPVSWVAAFSDVRTVQKKCGVTCAFFDLMRVVKRQLFGVPGNERYEKDVGTLVSFMFCRGEPLPMNREGLAKTRDRPPLDVLSFEAMKKNCARLVTGPDRETWHPVRSSLEKIFVGEQFNEGTGYCFELYERPRVASRLLLGRPEEDRSAKRRRK